MNRDESERLWALVRALQRAPEAVDDAEAQRAVTVLTASRSDAVYLLLQRVLVLETALERIRAQQPAVPAPSPFLREASVIAAGVVGGGLVLGALDALGAEIGVDAADLEL
ncbi:MAG: hypothetical protein AB7U92_10060 [Piscinibacter sp.]|uniref:hypothetical protein n=1 Tax=Piscinibacter sp. TaxID=1903157 RepID=UPI003D14D03D